MPSCGGFCFGLKTRVEVAIEKLVVEEGGIEVKVNAGRDGRGGFENAVASGRDAINATCNRELKWFRAEPLKFAEDYPPRLSDQTKNAVLFTS